MSDSAASSFGGVVEVFFRYCLDEQGFANFIEEVARPLLPGGRFFSYTPSKTSDAFRDHAFEFVVIEGQKPQ